MSHPGYARFSEARSTFYRAYSSSDDALRSGDLSAAYAHVLMMDAAATVAWNALAHIPVDDDDTLDAALEMKGLALNLSDRVSCPR